MNESRVLRLAKELAELTEQAAVRRLAHPEDGDAEARFADLAGILDQRQKILAALQSADTSKLSANAREEFNALIQRVRKADGAMTATLQEHAQTLQKQMVTTLHARGAIRAYRPGDGERPKTRGRFV